MLASKLIEKVWPAHRLLVDRTDIFFPGVKSPYNLI